MPCAIGSPAPVVLFGQLGGDIILALAVENLETLRDPTVQQQFAALGAEAVGSTPEAFNAVLEKDLVKWAKVAREANVKAE